MKTLKTIVMAIMVLMSLPSHAQEECSTNKTNEDGSQYVTSQAHWIRTGFTDTHPLSFSVSAHVDRAGTIKYYLILTYYTSKFEKDAVLLIKTSNDNVVKLFQDANDYRTQTSGMFIQGHHLDIANGIYTISHDDLALLYHEGIKKLRIELPTGYQDIEYKQKKIDSYLVEFQTMCDAVLYAISHKKSIEDDF